MPYVDPFEEEVFNSADEFNSEDDVNAPEYPLEGIYHTSVQSVDTSVASAPGAVFFVFEILGGNVKGQEGKTIRWVLWPVHPNAKDIEQAKKSRRKKIMRLTLALGMRKEGEFPTFRINEDWWHTMEGKQMVCKVSHKKQKSVSDSGKETEWVNAVTSHEDMFAIGSKEVADVPVNKEAASIAGYLSQQAPATPATADI